MKCDLYIRKDSCTPSRAVKWHEFSLVNDMCGSVGVLVGLEATRVLVSHWSAYYSSIPSII